MPDIQSRSVRIKKFFVLKPLWRQMSTFPPLVWPFGKRQWKMLMLNGHILENVSRFFSNKTENHPTIVRREISERLRKQKKRLKAKAKKSTKKKREEKLCPKRNLGRGK